MYMYIYIYIYTHTCLERWGGAELGLIALLARAPGLAAAGLVFNIPEHHILIDYINM